jgi:hypothetical protein
VDPVHGGGYQGGGGSPFFRKIYQNYVKIVENETVITFFFKFWNPFLSCLDPSLKKKKKQNIDLLNAHLKTEQFIGRKILCLIQHIFLLTLFSSSE